VVEHTVDPHLSELIGSWVCSDHQNMWTIETHAFTYRTLKYFNIMHTFNLMEQSLSSSDNPSGWIIEGWISKGPLYNYYSNRMVTASVQVIEG